MEGPSVPVSGRVVPLWLALVIASPGLLWAAAIVVLLLAEVAGAPILTAPSVTLSEAAALGDKGDIVRLVGRAVDPNRRGYVRPGLLGRDEYTVTPLEAAIGSHRSDVIELLLDSGAIMNEGSYQVLRCLAEESRDHALATFLERRMRGASPVDCSTVKTPW